MTGTILHAPCEIIQQLLVDLGVASLPTSTSWPSYAFNEPGIDEDSGGDNSITVVDTGVIHQGRHMHNGRVSQRYTFSIAVRSIDDNAAYAKAHAICVALDESVRLTSVTVGSSTYLIYSASKQNGPLSLGREPGSAGRVVFTINYSVVLRKTT